MAKIVEFRPSTKTNTSNVAKGATVPAQAYPDTFHEAVEYDIQNFSNATGLDRDEVIERMQQLYRKYPMLIEYVRSPEVLLKK